MKINNFFVVLFFLNYNVTISQTTAKSNPNLESQFIVEVFGNTITNDSQHYKNLQKLLRERVVFIKEPFQENEKFSNISQTSLLNKYNNNLVKDITFDENNFNILKYNLNFFSPNTKVYRFDNSDWLIVINP